MVFSRVNDIHPTVNLGFEPVPLTGSLGGRMDTKPNLGDVFVLVPDPKGDEQVGELGNVVTTRRAPCSNLFSLALCCTV